MSIVRSAAIVAALSTVLLACGERDPSEGAAEPAPGTTPAAEVTADAATSARPSAISAQVAAPLPAQTVQLEQSAVWPASDVVFDTPEEAAADFVSTVFEVEPALSEFRAGDQRSGEIDVLYDGAEVSEPQFRSGLALRKMTPTEGWFVIGGRNESMTITTPEAAAAVARGPLSVQGSARGFEGTLGISAFPMGDVSSLYDVVNAQGGAFETPAPYSATLDLSSATPGPAVLLLRGDTSLDDDPGEFSVIPITITDALPASR